jgi:hypothetical protein
MPTLQPQRLSGLVVTPTVELAGGIWKVSLAIDVGVSRTPPPATVSREDLIVELKNPSDGSLEPIASPDPGPIPVRALRVIQARAEFTFGQGGSPATELVVTLKGDRKSFPMSQTFSPTGCLRGEPKEGSRFPAISIPGPASIVTRLPPIVLQLVRPGCCVRRFDVPHNPVIDATAKSESYEIEADFLSRGRKCRCSCCEYRQYVRGTFTDANSAAVRFDMPSGALDPTRYCEDGAIDEFAPGQHGFYGHRATSTAGDEYTGKQGCTYRGREVPACPSTDTAHLEFLGLIIDRCRARVIAKRTWVVDL